MRIELDLELPAGLIDKELESQLVNLAREDIVLRLFEERRIEGGFAASLLQLTQRRGIPLTDYTPEDLLEDLAVMDKLTAQGAEPADAGRRE